MNIQDTVLNILLIFQEIKEPICFLEIWIRAQRNPSMCYLAFKMPGKITAV